MRFALYVEQNVSRLNVSMQDAVFVRVMQCARHFRDEFRRLSNRHRRAFATGRIRRGGPDYFIKLTAFDKLHAEITRAITLADFMDWNDTGVLQIGGSLCFKAKTLQVRFARPMTQAN